jgi:hypothetical protein
MSDARTTAQRITDSLEVMSRNGHGWLATASPGGDAHLIAVSALWTGATIVVATLGDSPTARNLAAGGSSRLALGSADDAVLVDVNVAERRPAGPGSGDIGEAFTTAMGWDPADEPGSWDYFVLVPGRVQAYRGYGERLGSTVMRDGRWLS